MQNLERDDSLLNKPEIDSTSETKAEAIELENTNIDNESKIIKGEENNYDKLQTSAIYLDSSSLEIGIADHCYLELVNGSKVQAQEIVSGQLTIGVDGEAYVSGVKSSNVIVEGKVVISGDFMDSKLKTKDNSSIDVSGVADSFVTIGRNTKAVIGNCVNSKIRISTGATVLIKNLENSSVTIEDGAVVIIENQDDGSLVSNTQLVENPITQLPNESTKLSDEEIQKNLEVWQQTMSEAKQAEDELRAEYQQKKSELDEGQKDFSREIDDKYGSMFSSLNERLLEKLESQTNIPEEEKAKMIEILKSGIKA